MPAALAGAGRRRAPRRRRLGGGDHGRNVEGRARDAAGERGGHLPAAERLTHAVADVLIQRRAGRQPDRARKAVRLDVEDGARVDGGELPARRELGEEEPEVVYRIYPAARPTA